MPQPGVRAVPLSPSSTAESRPTGDKFGDMDGRACPVLIGQHGAMAIEQASRPNALLDIRDRRDAILAVAARRGAHNVRVFGSVAADRADIDSDVDFLVDLEPGRSLFDLGGLMMDLQGLLGVEVDVVTVDGLRPTVRAVVLAEAVPL